MREHGLDNFEISVVEEVSLETRDEVSEKLNELEMKYISEMKPRYNAAPGGLGRTGVPWTDERRAKFKEMMSGENNPSYGKPKSEETRKKLSEALKGRVISEESRKKTSETMKGVKKSDETKQKMKEACKNRPNNLPTGKDHHGSKSIDQFDLDGNLLRTFESARAAAAALSIQTSGICMCCKGKLKSSGGFIWKYSCDNVGTDEGVCNQRGQGQQTDGDSS